tara:strand:- start:278 stop:907 length:630 start_codon:yes stop_codon:yes gene_type:complete
MNIQKIFKFNFNNSKDNPDIFVNKTNIGAYEGITGKENNHIFLYGPQKSGKSLFASIWLEMNEGVKYSNNFEYLIRNNHNILIDNNYKYYPEENIFHLINHAMLNNKKILITSNLNINEINFSLKDLVSRLKTFTYLKIDNPDDDMLLNILTKLFLEKQFVINSHEIFQYIIKNANRTYKDIYEIVKKLDTLSIEKKRQLTIPLIKEIL